MNLKRSPYILGTIAALALVIMLFSGCPNPTAPPPGDNVEILKTGTPGATSLAASSDGSRIYIGHVTYSDGGALKYYDTTTGTIQTIVDGVDMGDFVLDETNNQVIATSHASSANGTYYIDLSSTPYTTQAITSSGSAFAGSDILLHNGIAYVIASDIDWMGGTADNTLYYFPTDDFDPVTEVDLGTSVAYGFNRIGVYGSELYYTDTVGGEVWKSGLDGSGMAKVTTAGDGAAGMIYFHGGLALVADGFAPSMGVFRFDPASPPGSASQFSDSAATSAQFMAFVSSTQAFVTDFGGGVYGFDPTDVDSSFTIVSDSDLSYVDGVNGYGFQDIVAANNHLYVAVGTFFGDESELMIVDSY